MNESITVQIRDGEQLRFDAPPSDTYVQWFTLHDGVLSVRESNEPRRMRYIPAVSIDWWQLERDDV